MRYLLGNYSSFAALFHRNVNCRRPSLKGITVLLHIFADDVVCKQSNTIVSVIDDGTARAFQGICCCFKEDFLEIDAALANVLQDIAVLMEEKNNRSRFNANYSALRQKYEEADMEFDVLSVLDGVAEGVKNELDRKDNIWSSKHLSQVPANVPAIHTWLQDTDVLPTYLSEDTITAYNDMHKKVEAKLSEAKVKDIVLRFKELSASEQTECFGLISQAIKE